FTIPPPPLSTLFPYRRSSDLRRAVEGPDVVEPEEAALEEVVPLRVLPVHPPGEVDEELLNDPLDEVVVPVAGDLVDTERGPGVRSEEHTSELQSRRDLVCRLL